MNTDDVIDEICSAYLSARKQKIGYTPQITASLLKALPKAAEICIRIGADPVSYVKAQEKYCTLKDFFPNQLHTSMAESYYNKYRGSFNLDLEGLFQVQLRYVVNSLSSGRVLKNVLKDDFLDLSPWFRVFLTKEVEPEVMELYAERAKAEMTPEIASFIAKKGWDINRLKDI